MSHSTSNDGLMKALSGLDSPLVLNGTMLYDGRTNNSIMMN